MITWEVRKGSIKLHFHRKKRILQQSGKERHDESWLGTSKKSLGRFWNTNLSKYYDLYLQSDILLQVDVFESFRNKCIEIYELALFYFLSSLVLTW